MKIKFLLTASLLTIGVSAVAQDATVTLPGTGVAPAAAATAPSFTEAQLAEEMGWFLGKQSGLAELEFTPEQIAAVVKGLTSAASGHESPYELAQIGPAMNEFIQRKQAGFMSKMKQKGAEETAKFMTDLKAKSGVVVTPDGLAYEVVAPGEGPAPKPEDTVKVHYTGTLVNGTVFDSSREPRQPGAPVEPVEFQLNQVIPGWTEGLQKISKGGRIKLYIPPQLAYGDEGRPGIPPASTLVFDVELLDITPAAAATPAPAEAPAPAAVK